MDIKYVDYQGIQILQVDMISNSLKETMDGLKRIPTLIRVSRKKVYVLYNFYKALLTKEVVVKLCQGLVESNEKVIRRAIVGVDPSKMPVVQAIIQKTGVTDKTQIFEGYPQAVNWLLEGDPSQTTSFKNRIYLRKKKIYYIKNSNKDQ